MQETTTIPLQREIATTLPGGASDHLALRQTGPARFELRSEPCDFEGDVSTLWSFSKVMHHIHLRQTLSLSITSVASASLPHTCVWGII
jgi:hypothetical protein